MLEDILAGLSGGLSGGLRGYSFQKELEAEDQIRKEREAARLAAEARLQATDAENTRRYNEGLRREDAQMLASILEPGAELQDQQVGTLRGTPFEGLVDTSETLPARRLRMPETPMPGRVTPTGPQAAPGSIPVTPRPDLATGPARAALPVTPRPGPSVEDIAAQRTSRWRGTPGQRAEAATRQARQSVLDQMNPAARTRVTMQDLDIDTDPIRVGNDFLDPLTMEPVASAETPPAVGSFEDYVRQAYGERPTPEQIRTARREYNQADDRPAAGPQSPVAVIGDDGEAVYVQPSAAVGRRPANAREQGRPVQSGDINRLAEFDTSLDDVAVLRDTVTGIDATGTAAKIGAAVPNFITELTGWGEDAKSKQAVIDRVKQVIGKALEGGVLRKEDEYKYEKILPTIGDVPTVVASKLDGLEEAIRLRRQRLLENLDAGGFDTAQFGESPTQGQPRAATRPAGTRQTPAAPAAGGNPFRR